MYSVVVLMALSAGGDAIDARGCGGRGGKGGCYSSCYSGCYSGYYAPVYTCGTPMFCGGVIVVPAKPKKKDGGKGKEDETSLSATIVVNLPADAKLTIDGEATVSTSAQRVFVSPELEEGKQFTYLFKARIMRDGKPVVFEKKVAVQAGKTVEVTLTAPTAEIAD